MSVITTPLLPFADSCVQGIFLKRYKRFSVLAQIEGREVWIHTNNSGSMQGLLEEGNSILVSRSENPKRKTPYTLELIKSKGIWVGVNTSVPNKMLERAFKAGRFDFAKGYDEMLREQNLPPELCFEDEKSRLDGLLLGEGKPPLWVECKNVTLVHNGAAAFPDAKTIRGQKHMRSLINIAQKGERAACFFLVQRGDGHAFAPAAQIDEAYAALFWQARDAGVEIYPYRAHVSQAGIDLGELLPLVRP